MECLPFFGGDGGENRVDAERSGGCIAVVDEEGDGGDGECMGDKRRQSQERGERRRHPARQHSDCESNEDRSPRLASLYTTARYDQHTCRREGAVVAPRFTTRCWGAVVH